MSKGKISHPGEAFPARAQNALRMELLGQVDKASGMNEPRKSKVLEKTEKVKHLALG